MRRDQKLLRRLQGWWQGKVGNEWVMGTRERESEEAEINRRLFGISMCGGDLLQGGSLATESVVS